jgi:hypothetical protein
MRVRAVTMLEGTAGEKTSTTVALVTLHAPSRTRCTADPA